MALVFQFCLPRFPFCCLACSSTAYFHVIAGHTRRGVAKRGEHIRAISPAINCGILSKTFSHILFFWLARTERGVLLSTLIFREVVRFPLLGPAPGPLRGTNQRGGCFVWFQRRLPPILIQISTIVLITIKRITGSPSQYNLSKGEGFLRFIWVRVGSLL